MKVGEFFFAQSEPTEFLVASLLRFRLPLGGSGGTPLVRG